MQLAIFSAARDGSSLLLRLLDGAPALVAYPLEMKAFAHLIYAERRQEIAESGGDEARVAALLQEHPIAGVAVQSYADFYLGELRKHYPGLPEGSRLAAGENLELDGREYSFGEAVDAFLTGFARLAGDAQNVAFKTTEAEAKHAYAQSRGDLRALHIVRDPLEQYRSTKRTVIERPGFLHWYARGDLLSTFVRRWRLHVQAYLDLARASPGRHLLVRYEDVVANPEEHVRRIADWAGIEPPPEPTVQTVFGTRPERLPENPSRAGVETPLEVVSDMAARHGYDDPVSARERATLATYLGDLAHEIGYDGDASARRGRARLALSWLPPARWELSLARKRQGGLRELAARRAFVLRHPPHETSASSSAKASASQS